MHIKEIINKKKYIPLFEKRKKATKDTYNSNSRDGIELEPVPPPLWVSTTLD
jgi:hypothetical protein